MEPFVLTDAQWAKMAGHCLGRPEDPGRTGTNNRLFVEAVLWIVRTGRPWRELPAIFGNSTSTYVRYRYWKKSDVFKRLFDAVLDDPEMEYAMIDATIIHRHGKGGKPGLRGRPGAMRIIARPPASWL